MASLYRKFRPVQLKDIVGQSHVVNTLKQASINDEFAHSYMFSGERGCGKTSIARILASLMTCENADAGKVCGQCRACKTIHAGASLDVRELDGAKNNKVEHVEVLIEGASYSPQELKRKIFIIDECHRLTDAAMSSLLKIVEEPPEYLTWIFCTTEVKKIPNTILSRCQRYNFSKIPSKDIAKRLQLISKKEEITISDGALYALAKMGRGSMRDAIGYLDQIGIRTKNSDVEISDEHVQKYFGTVDRLAILNIVKAVKTKNIPLILDLINDLIIVSVDIKDILFEISEAFRNIMILKASEGKTTLIDLPDYEIEELKEVGKSFSMKQLVKFASLFSNIEKKMDFNINDRWIMEATLINCVAILSSN